MRFSRRQFIGGALGRPSPGPRSSGGQAELRSAAVFPHGVASGDPLTDRVMLWTRATPRSTTRRRCGALDRGRRRAARTVVASGTAETSDARDFTVKVDAGGLRPGRTYYYAFEPRGERSPIGRTKTLPQDDVVARAARVDLVLQLPAGYFNVYRCVANRATSTPWCTWATTSTSSPTASTATAPDRARADAGRRGVHAADYRMRYATYRSDVDLQAAHAAHPFIAVWDDHEVINDWWRGGAAGHRAARRLGHALRAGLQAYREWMPVRENGAGTFHLYRGFRFGGSPIC
jgi:alkaline phosphatase D